MEVLIKIRSISLIMTKLRSVISTSRNLSYKYINMCVNDVCRKMSTEELFVISKDWEQLKSLLTATD